MKVVFQHSATKRDICVLLDVPHMLKLFRNAFHAFKGFILEGFEHPALWEHFELLLKWEESNGWRAGSRITPKQVFFERYVYFVYII